MKILTCNVENFGTLHHVRCDLDDGLNSLNEGNGWGKTTFAAFILSMLYGMPEMNFAESGNIRERYMPWQGGKFGGSITFETASGRYTVTRYFGTSKVDDTCTVTDEVGRDITERFSNPGEDILGVDSEGFRSSAFIFQNDLRLGDGESIRQRLRELAGSSGDRRRYEEAVRDLKNEAESLREIEKKSENGAYEFRNEIHGDEEVQRKLEELRSKRENVKDIEKELGKKEKAFAEAKEELDNFMKRSAEKGNRIIQLIFGVMILILAFIAVFGGAFAMRLVKGYFQTGATMAVVGVVLLIIGVVLLINRTNRLKEREYDEEVHETRENAARRACDEARDRLERMNKEIKDLEVYEERVQEFQKRNTEQKIDKDYAAKKLMLVEKAEKALERAMEELTQNYLDPIRERFHEFYRVLYPDGPRAEIRDDFTISVEGFGEMRELDSQSRGTQDLIELCVRFALVDVLYNEEKPCMVLDDVLNNLDDIRVNKVISSLEKMAERFQIVYLTCNTDRMPVNKK